MSNGNAIGDGEMSLGTKVAVVLRDTLLSQVSDENKTLQEENTKYEAMVKQFEDRRIYRPVEFIKTTPDGPVVVYRNFFVKDMVDEFWFDDVEPIDMAHILESEVVIDGMKQGVIKDLPCRNLVVGIENSGTPTEIHKLCSIRFASEDDVLDIELTISQAPEDDSLDGFEDKDFNLERLHGTFVKGIHILSGMSSFELES